MVILTCFISITRTNKWNVVFSEKGEPSPVIGYLSRKNAEGKNLIVEFLYAVKGLTAEDLTKESTLEYNGNNYRVLNPITLLKAKLANYTELPQNTVNQERQDLKHVYILVFCVANFLHQAHSQIAINPHLERGYINLLEETLQIVRSKQAIQTSNEKGLDFWACMPPVIAVSPHSKVKNFHRKRLLPIIAKDITFKNSKTQQ